MNKKAFPFLLRVTAVALLLLIAHGCHIFKDDMDECYDGVTVVLKVDPNTYKADEAEAAVQHAVIFVFDKSGNFLERRETEVNKEEKLWYPNAGELSVVGWLNKHETYGITQFENGTTRSDGRVRLTATRAVGDCLIPTDLFYGDVGMANISGSTTTMEHKEVYASRRVGSMTVTVRGLQDYASIYDSNFSIVVGQTTSAIDFFGEYCECNAVHTPPVAFNGKKEFVATNFNLMPTGNERLKVSIYHGEAGLIYETDTDKEGNLINVVADRTENILIDFTTGINVTIERTMWGVSYPWKTFN